MTAVPDDPSPGEHHEPVQSPAAGYGNLAESLMPVVLFIGANRMLGLGWAIGLVTAWSVFSMARRRQRGLPIGKFLPILTVLIVGRGIIGILTDNEDVYFGLGIAGKFAVGGALIAMVVARRNYLARLLPKVFGFDSATQAHREYRIAVDHLALAGGVYYVLSAGFDVWLLQNASVDGYVLIRFLVNWPTGMVVVLAGMAYLARRLARIPGFPGLLTVMESHVEAQQASRRPTKER